MIRSLKFTNKTNELNENCKDEFGKSKVTIETLRKMCEQENQNLKFVLNRNLNSGFLIKNKLPKISYILLQPKLLLTKNYQPFSKNLGGKHNPYNYSFDNKNTFKRNIYGSTFNY